MGKIRISKPVIAAESACDADIDSSYAGRLADAVDGKTGLIPVRMENDVIIQRISRDLYTGPLSGIRELYANEARACRTAMREHGASPEIHITINEQTRQLVIHGTDSMGISQERFLEIVSVLGRSDNFDGSESGQFGMGFASYMTLSDVVIVDSYSRETGEKYGIMGKGGIGFQIMERPSNLDSYGTRITMTMRPDAAKEPIAFHVKGCALLSGIPTRIIITDSDGDITDKYVRGSSVRGIARGIVGGVYNNRFEPGHMLYMSDGLMDVAACNNGSYKSGPKSFIARMPIDYQYNGRYKNVFSYVVVHIKDERRIPPLPTRDGFSASTEKMIDGRIDLMIEDRLSSMATTSLAEHIGRRENWMLDTAARNGIDVPGHDRRFSEIVISNGVTADGSQHSLASLLNRPGRHARLPLLTKSLDSRKIKAVELHDRAVPVFRPDDRSLVDDPLMAEAGFETLSAYVKRNSLQSSARAQRKTALYALDGKRAMSIYDDEADGDVICAPGRDDFEWIMDAWKRRRWCYHDFSPLGGRHGDPDLYRRYIHRLERNTVCVHSPPLPGSVSLSDFVERCGRILYETSLGILSGTGILQTGLRVRIFDAPDFRECEGLHIRDGVIAVHPGLHSFELYMSVMHVPDRLCVEDLAVEGARLVGMISRHCDPDDPLTAEKASAMRWCSAISDADVQSAYAMAVRSCLSGSALGEAFSGLDRAISSRPRRLDGGR